MWKIYGTILALLLLSYTVYGDGFDADPPRYVRERVTPSLDFLNAGPFYNGAAIVFMAGGQVAVVDTHGQFIIEPRAYMSGGLEIQGEVFPFPSEELSEGLIAFYNTLGEQVIPPLFLDAKPFREGLAAVRIQGFREGLWGFINIYGDVVIPPFFSDVGEFSQGLAPVQGDNNFWGYINPQGETVIYPTFCAVTPFSGGLATALLTHPYTQDAPELAVIDSYGNAIFWLEHPVDTPGFSHGLIVAAMPQDGEYDQLLFGFKNTAGEWVVPAIYDWVAPFSDGLAAVRLNGSTAFVDTYGNIVIPFANRLAGSFTQGRAPIIVDGLMGYMNTQGEIVIEPAFNIAENFANGIAVVGLVGEDGRMGYGFINLLGHELTPLKYQFAHGFFGNYAWVQQDNLWGILEIYTPAPSNRIDSLPAIIIVAIVVVAIIAWTITIKIKGE